MSRSGELPDLNHLFSDMQDGMQSPDYGRDRGKHPAAPVVRGDDREVDHDRAPCENDSQSLLPKKGSGPP